MARRLGVLAAILLLFACAPPAPSLPSAPVPAGPGVAVRSEPVALDPSDAAHVALGNFAYAGGLVLTSDQTARFHGLSDLKLTAHDGFLAVSDEGDLVRGRLTLDAAGRLAGVGDVTLKPLLGPDGQPLQGKLQADAEGIAALPDGDILISFERDHRIWRYPAASGPPHAAPMPHIAMPPNDGMEAIAALPAVAPDAYVVGAEDESRSWVCRLSSGCVDGTALPRPSDAGVVAAAPLGDDRIAWLFRHWSLLKGSVITLVVLDKAGAELDRMTLSRPLTVDNLEGLAAQVRPDGKVRFYLLADDNFSPAERTLLLAFDWTPKP
jgi:hypothetical protein